jgi:hypothetical protein
MGDAAVRCGELNAQPPADRDCARPVNLEIYEEVGMGEASLDYMKALRSGCLSRELD